MEKDNLYAMLGMMDHSVLAALPSSGHFQDTTRDNPHMQMTAASLFAFTADFEPTPINENSSAFNNSGPRPDENQLLRQVLSQANTVIGAENDFLLYGNSLGMMNHPSKRAPVSSSTAAATTSENTEGSLRPDTSTSITNAAATTTMEPTAAASDHSKTGSPPAPISSLSPAVTTGRWFDRFQDLIRFQQEHGHCCVPSHWPKNPPLAQWVKRQRHQYKRSKEGLHSTITPARIDALNKMKFVWDPHSAFWEERLNELYEFRDKYGHCNVPTKFPDNPQLAIWAKCQRRQFKLFVSDGPKRSNMTVDRIAKLSRVGFVFNPRQVNNNRTGGA